MANKKKKKQFNSDILPLFVDSDLTAILCTFILKYANACKMEEIRTFFGALSKLLFLADREHALQKEISLPYLP